MFTAIVSLATGGFASLVQTLGDRRFDWRLLDDNDTVVVPDLVDEPDRYGGVVELAVRQGPAGDRLYVLRVEVA